MGKDRTVGTAQTFRSVLFDFGGVAGERIVRALVGVVVSSLLARHLGVVAFGTYNLGLALGAVGGVVATLGLDGVLVREMVRRPARGEGLLRVATAMRALVGLVAWAGCVFYAWLTEENWVVVGVASFGCFSAAANSPLLGFQSVGRARIAALWQTVVFLVMSALRIGLVGFDAGLAAFAWVIVLELALLGPVLAWAWGRERMREPTTGYVAGSALLVTRLLRAGAPWWVSGASVAVYTKVDQVILHRLAGAEELGLYAASSRLTDQAHLLPMALAVPLLGRLVALRGRDMERLIMRYMAVSAFAGFACAVILVGSAPWLMGLIYGASFDGAVDVLRIQAMAIPFIFLGVARSQVMVAMGRPIAALLATLAAAVFSIGLNLWLIPSLGALGAAMAACGAQVFAAWLSTFFMPGLRSIALMQTEALFLPLRLWRKAS